MNLSVHRLLTGKAILKATLTLLGQQKSFIFPSVWLELEKKLARMISNFFVRGFSCPLCQVLAALILTSSSSYHSQGQDLCLSSLNVLFGTHPMN